MRPERIVSLLTEDGEIVGVAKERLPGKSYGQIFMTIFDPKLSAMIEGITSLATVKLLLRLPQHLGFDTFRRLDQRELAAQMHTAQGNISMSLATLVRAGLLERKGKGPTVTWRLSPEWGWRGTVDQYLADQDTRGKAAKRAAAPPPAAVDDRVTHIMGTRVLATWGAVCLVRVTSRSAGRSPRNAASAG